MKRIGLFLIGFIVAGLLVAAPTCHAGMDFSAGYSGLFTFQDDGTVTGSMYDLGACYRPDKVMVIGTPRASKFTLEPSNFEFFTDQAIRDGSPDLNITGMGYVLKHWSSMEIIAQGAVVTKTLGNNQFKIGEVTAVKIPFTSLGQGWVFKFMAGFDGDNPIMGIGLGFSTQ